MKTTILKNRKSSDKDVEKMIQTWDVVYCYFCNKKISMLNAKMIDGRYFICKEGHNHA